MDGVEATRRANSLFGNLRIIALSMYGEEEYYLRMIQAGACGFLKKDSDIEEVVCAIKQVMLGEKCFPAAVLYSLVAQGSTGKDEILTDREREIVELICHGFTTREIASRLFLSRRTVEKHRSNLLSKTSCHNTAQLVTWAMKNR
jgi:DNA-binding NarL/FixJ family response regulator